MREKNYPVLEPSYLLKSVDDESMSSEQLEKLLEGIPMQWTWGTHLTTDQLVLIPFSWFYAINEFNGPSAGNTIEEAALQGISEVVERHVCSKVNRYRLETPLIDQESISDPVARELLEKFRKNNIELYLSDFSLDTGICTVGALAYDRETFPEMSEIVFTAGTTPGPDKAIIRAVTEVAQLAGDFNTGSNYVASGLPKPLSLDEVSYITNSSRTITTPDMVELSDDNIKVEISNCMTGTFPYRS